MLTLMSQLQVPVPRLLTVGYKARGTWPLLRYGARGV